METTAQKAKQGQILMVWGLITNLGLTILKFTGAIIGNSQALLADALDSFSDFISDIVVIFSLKFSHQPADQDHPFGHGKIETLATVFIGVLIVTVGGHLAIDSMTKFLSGKIQKPTWIALIPGVIAISIKEFLFRYQKHHGKILNMISLQASAWHHRSDGFTSLAALIGIAGSLMGIDNLDVIAGFIVSLMIVFFGGNIIYQSSKDLIETSVPNELIEKISDTACHTPGVHSVCQIRARHVGTRLIVNIIIHVDGQMPLHSAHAIADEVEHALSKPPIAADDILVHVEPTHE